MDSGKQQGILVIVIAHNEWKSVKIGLKILREELRGTGSEILVVDNFSDDGLQEWLPTQRGISYLIFDEKMEGYGKILDVAGREFGTYRDILLVRANYFFTPGSIAHMKALLDTEGVWAVGPMCNAFSGEQKCFGIGSYEKALAYQVSHAGEGGIRTAYLNTDVMLIKGETLPYVDREAGIPGAAMQGYMRNALERNTSFAIAKASVCFAVCGTNDKPYRQFQPDVYRREKLRQLLYSFGDISYKGVYLYKYLEVEILAGINYRNGLQDAGRNLGLLMWGTDEVALAADEEMEAVRQTLGKLPSKDILFVTLFLRRMHRGWMEHTAMEPFLSTLDEREYLDLEYVADLKADGAFQIPTKNRYPMLISAIPSIYGISEIDKQELMDFLWNYFIQPLEEALGFSMEPLILRSCLYKASYILKERESYLKFYKEVFGRVKPKVIIYSHGQDRLLTYLRDAAMEYGIPTLEIAHGVAAAKAYHKNLAYADRLAVYSDIVAEKSRLLGNDRVVVTGKPGVYEKILFPSKEGTKIIITFISSLENEILGYAERLAGKLETEKYLVIYKAHSAEMRVDFEIQEMESKYPNLKFASGNVDIRDLVGISDIVVGIRSTGLFDALPFPMVKVIAMKDKAEDYGEEHPKDILEEVVKNGEVVMAEGEEDLYQEVLTYERGTMYRPMPNSFWPIDAEKKFRKLVNRYLGLESPDNHLQAKERQQ